MQLHNYSLRRHVHKVTSSLVTAKKLTTSVPAHSLSRSVNICVCSSTLTMSCSVNFKPAPALQFSVGHLSSTDSWQEVTGEAYSTTSLDPNTSTWCSLVSACGNSSHVKLFQSHLFISMGLTSLASSGHENVANAQFFCWRG